ncbi:MAG TPA: aminomethyl-transferring glycine dehydrogenase subunit GcvPA [Anaerolineae bacterium]|nr:aminomethyl-transferring glycine dehydrogenase subunit GcvPA [Anaerolineae bacterium]HNU03744.1 aminomethyl-transferring glycine dehydrogenase subunit GcvPA [Anaerolineae bacterium]
MPFIANTDADQAAMLAAVGVERVEDLFHDVPEAYRFPELNLPEALSELEVLRELASLANENEKLDELTSFLGAGAYRHFIPTVVDFLSGRSEFYTAYTPYQPEVSQGTLQAVFEYQSMIAALTGMDASNASHYDGATATAEAVIMALNTVRGKRKRVILSPTLNPQYREVVRTYTQGMGLEIVGDQAGDPDFHALLDMCEQNTACVVVQNPDFLGNVHSPKEMQDLADAVHACGALLAVAVDPISLGLFTPPGQYGADIVMGEGQSLGIPLSFGGPYLGFFTMREKDVRKSAGRIAGETVDLDGRTGYVLTLSTREQHIKRSRATSNICSNQALMALRAAIYLATMGKQGLRSVAEQCYHKGQYAATKIGMLPGYEIVNKGPFFKEFVVRCPLPVADVKAHLLLEWGIIPGYDLTQDYPELGECLLVCVTEMNTVEEIDALAEALAEAAELAPEGFVLEMELR